MKKGRAVVDRRGSGCALRVLSVGTPQVARR